MLLSKQPGDTGIYASATSTQVRLYYVLDRVLPFVGDITAAAEAVGELGSGGAAVPGFHLDEISVSRRIAAAPACVPREHLRMLYRLTANGTGASRPGGAFRADDYPPTASPLYPTSSVSNTHRHTSSSYIPTSAAAALFHEHPEQRLPDEASSVHRWGSPLIPFHTVHCSSSGRTTATVHGNGADSALGGKYHKSTQKWAAPPTEATASAQDSGVTTGHAFPVPINHGASATAGGNIDPVPRSGRFANSPHGVLSTSAAAAVPTTLSLSCATDCLLFFLASSEGHSWIGRSDATTLSALRVSTSLPLRRHGGTEAGLNGGSRYTGLNGAVNAASSSSLRPPRPFSSAFGVHGNTSFPTHSLTSSERMAATPPNTVVDSSVVPHAAALIDSGSEEDEVVAEENDEDDSVDDGGADAARDTTGRCTHRRGSFAGPTARTSSTDGLEAFPGVPPTTMVLPAGRTFPRHDRTITASGWDPRNSAILALGRQGGIVQLLDVEYLTGSAASTRCSSTTSSAATEDTAEPRNSNVNGAARTVTSGGGGGGARLMPYSGADHLSCSVIQQREMVGPVTALDWMPQSHLTVVAARRRDGLGCYAELLDLRASHDGVTYLGAPPEVFGVPVCARGTDSAAPSVLCSAEHVACHPSQRYVATVGTSRMRDIVQLWDVRMATQPVAYQVYARAGYTSLCWCAAQTSVVLGTTRDGGLRVHRFKELASHTATTTNSGSSGAHWNTTGSGAPTAAGSASHRSRRRRGTNSGPQHTFTASAGEPEALRERWGVGAGGHPRNNINSYNSGTEAEAEDDLLDDSGSFRSGASVEGAGTALSSTTEGSNALVQVSVKAQSALKCRLPSRVPAASVAWVCRPSAEGLSAVAGGQAGETGDVASASPLRRSTHGKGSASRRRHSGVDSEEDRDVAGAGGEGEGKAVRISGVMERGCRTDLTQLLLLNSKNGELYAQVFNPRGSTVTIMNQNVGLVGSGPNAFLVRSSMAYKTAMYAYEEAVMRQLERQAVLAAATSATAESDVPSLSIGPTTANSGNVVGSAGGTSPLLSGGANGGGGDVEASSGTAAAAARRRKDHPVDLMGLGLLDEEDEDEEDEDEDVRSADGAGSSHHHHNTTTATDDVNTNVAGGPRERHAERQAGCDGNLSYTSRNGGDAAAGQSYGGTAEVTAGVLPGVPDRATVQAKLFTAPAVRASQTRRAGPAQAAKTMPHRREEPSNGMCNGGRGETGAAASEDPPAHSASAPLTGAPSRPSSPTAEVQKPEDASGPARAASSQATVPQELSYCQFHRVDRARLIWRRLRGGFSCDPIRNLRVLLNEGIDREAYSAFLYGCCVSMLLYPSSTGKGDASENQDATDTPATANLRSSFPFILGAQRAVPGMLELLVSERRLRAQLGLRDMRLTSRFRPCQHNATVLAEVATSMETESVSSTEAAVAVSASPLSSTVPAAMRRNPLNFAAPGLPGLPSATDRVHKGLSGFFHRPFEATAATMQSGGGRLPTPGSLAVAAHVHVGGDGAGSAGRGAAAVTSTTPMLPGCTRVKSTTTGGSSIVTEQQQPTHAAAMGMLHQLILQSMGWLEPPVQCSVDTHDKSASGGVGDGGPVGDTAASHRGLEEGGGEVRRTAPQHASSRHPPRHPAEKFFVQGDGLGQQSLQEALERRVTVLVLLDRLKDAAELLSLYSTHNPQYPSIALTLSAAQGQTSALLNLTVPESPGVTFWAHLLLTYLQLLMDRQRRAESQPINPAESRYADQRQTADASAAGTAAEEAEEVVPVKTTTPTTTRFDRLFTVPEQKAVVLRLLRGHPRLATPDKVALAAALLLPPHYHGAHVNNLIEVLQVLVHQQYRACAGLVSGTSTGCGAAPPSNAPIPTDSSPSPPVARTQRHVDGKRALPSSAVVPASTPLNVFHAPRPQGRPIAQEGHLADVFAAGAGGAVDHFAPICGCSLLLVTAVEAASTDCRALQRYVDEAGDTQTTLCYIAVFGNITSSTFRLWREAYRRQLNELGLSLWRSQLDLQCVKLARAREGAGGGASWVGGVGGSGGAAGIGPDAEDGRKSGGAGARMPGVRGGVSGVDSAGPPSATGAAATLFHSGMPVPKRVPAVLGALGGDMSAAPASSAAAMMSTQTAMMMKRTLKGFAQTTATSTIERDRSMREAAAAVGTESADVANDRHRSVELRCNCGQAMHATALGKSSVSAMVSTNFIRRQLIPCGNPECRQWQTPMCTVCGERMEHRATELPPERFFAWCSVCLHGGHACHLREWFGKHTKCPVENCPCTCCDNALNTHTSVPS
ncbi:hypothetical protein ABB37_05392 [Leptomonas pyrrhocoris]|uniref:Uncharacterized protein n=1 Tax=Leptomonas pyrrhocoris TaxID=157538 RepID=A0A0M9G0D3_LEPPY|nr:hypothetical protein ABB37_05392 [Leptomonas pyrrhocoris]KPA79586.1 hypothetical protein ABB37_05392 [Leptomonas pyrrhocoris]|eukprot:XP_015658025.1 hypothetical protein ABB37_05392 [Leptomonas pyrrhocoris]